jgi:hypothetical protein
MFQQEKKCFSKPSTLILLGHVVVNALQQHATKLEEYLDENVWKVE